MAKCRNCQTNQMDGSRDPEDLWTELHLHYGAPVYLSAWSVEKSRAAIARGEVMWMLQKSDGYGSGSVTFRLAGPNDNLAPPFDHLHLLQAVTFGVRLEPLWIEILNLNDWDRLSDSRYFRTGR